MESSVRLKYGTGKFPGTRGAVIADIKEHVPAKEITALYKCGEGKDWYVTFTSPDVASGISDQTFTNSSGTTVKIESLDRRRVRFRVHWFPFHMKGELVEDYMELYGDNVDLSYDTQTYDGIQIKTGTMTGSMTCTEKQYNSLPYRANINGRVVLITVMGRQTVCLRCGEIGHQRATCPSRQTRKSYAAATRGAEQEDEDNWTQVGSRNVRQSTANQAVQPACPKPVPKEPEETHVPLSTESEVGEKEQHMPLSSESEVGEEKQHLPLSTESEVGGDMGLPQDRRGRGQDDEEEMETKQTTSRKRKKDTNETVVKKVKDDNDLDLTGDTKPILSMGLVPPSNEVIEIEINNVNVNGL